MNSEKLSLFLNSDKYWEAYWDKIDEAKDLVCIVTYDMDNKMISNNVMKKLIEAAKRGVKVLLVVEHLNFYLNNSMVRKLKKEGGIVVKPNKFSKSVQHLYNLNFKKTFSRFHQKVTLVDDDVFVGSINIAAEYSDIKYGDRMFVDLNVLAQKTPCKRKVLSLFRQILFDNLNQRKYEPMLGYLEDKIDALPESQSDESFLIERPPYESEIQDKLFADLEKAEKSIRIVQSYWMQLERIEELLLKAKQRGVEVEIITATKRDQVAYKEIYNSVMFKNLIDAGIPVFEYQDRFLHAKAVEVDGEKLQIGSFNFDVTSFVFNNEANYFISKNKHNQDVFLQFDHMFEEIKEDCVEVKPLARYSWFRMTKWRFWLWFLQTSVKLARSREPKYKD